MSSIAPSPEGKGWRSRQFPASSETWSLPSAARAIQSLPPAPTDQAATYRLGSDDRVRIITYGEEQLSNEFRVNDSGNLALALLGSVRARGLTTPELSREIAGERYVCLTFDDDCRGALDYAFPIRAERGMSAACFGVPGGMDESRRGVFGWNECRRLAASGMDVGAHSFSHRRIAALTATEVEHDFAAARARIEAELDRPCLHLACPWGQPGTDCDSMRDPALARAAG